MRPNRAGFRVPAEEADRVACKKSCPPYGQWGEGRQPVRPPKGIHGPYSKDLRPCRSIRLEGDAGALLPDRQARGRIGALPAGPAIEETLVLPLPDIPIRGAPRHRDPNRLRAGREVMGRGAAAG